MTAAVGVFGQDAHHKWYQSSASTPMQPHGKGRKRPAETSLETEQRLSKRLDLLNLENGPRLYLPVGSGSARNTTTTIPAQPPSPTSPVKPSLSKKTRPPPPDDCMLVEDTPHRVYIHDLAAELSDIESDSETPIFLPDIEKHIAKIPQHILAAPELKPTKDNQMILYQVPSSLTIPAEQDKVRRAIAEARARVREKQASPVPEPGFNDIRNKMMGTPPPPEEYGVDGGMHEDPDAMDIDG